MTSQVIYFLDVNKVEIYMFLYLISQIFIKKTTFVRDISYQGLVWYYLGARESLKIRKYWHYY